MIHYLRITKEEFEMCRKLGTVRLDVPEKLGYCPGDFLIVCCKDEIVCGCQSDAAIAFEIGAIRRDKSGLKDGYYALILHYRDSWFVLAKIAIQETGG